MEDLTTNVTTPFQLSWSTFYNATLDVFTNSDGGFQEIYSAFSLHKKFSVIGSSAPHAPPPTCTSQPLPGGMDPPPVQDFVFSGEQPFPPDSTNMVWIWKLGHLVYGTQQTPQQQPAVLLDADKKVVYAFASVEYFTPESWPPTFFSPPSACKAA